MSKPVLFVLWAAHLAATGSADPYASIAQFFQYGVLGVVVVGFIRGWIWPRPPVDRLQKDYDRLQAQYDELVATYQREIIPTLARAADALTRRAPRS